MCTTVSGAGAAHHAVVDALGHRVPRLVVLHVPVVAVVRAVAHAPAVVRHQDGRVHHVAHKVVQRLVRREALVAAAQRSEQARVSGPPLHEAALHCPVTARQESTVPDRRRQTQQRTGRPRHGLIQQCGRSVMPSALGSAPVVANHEQRPEHGPLRQPVQRPQRPGVRASRCEHAFWQAVSKCGAGGGKCPAAACSPHRRQCPVSQPSL